MDCFWLSFGCLSVLFWTLAWCNIKPQQHSPFISAGCLIEMLFQQFFNHYLTAIWLKHRNNAYSSIWMTQHEWYKSSIFSYHSCCGSSMTRRILNFLGVVTWVCSTSPAEAAVCLTTLVMELKKPAPVDWTGWGFLSGAGEVAGGVGPDVGDLAGVLEAGGGGWAGSGLWRSVM